MASPTERPPFPIDDPDTSVELPGFSIDDEATIDTGSIPPPAFAEVDDAPTDRPPPPDAPARGGSSLRTPAEIAAWVDEGRPLVDLAARRVHREVGGRADVDELASVGRFALVEAARHFDPSRSRFAPYAQRKIRWAMLDHVRRDTQRRGCGPRGAALTALERMPRDSRDTQNDELPTDETARAALAEAIAQQAAALVVGIAIGRARETDLSPDSTINPERAVGERRNVDRLRAAIDALPEAQRSLVERHYFHDERFDHIAESLGVSKSWASRLHAQAIATLAKALGSR
jgi:RNA polymerase sigma factor for flagellar operon FliA